ncbi:MAG: hypothetical protein NC453_21705 [Muribaculum sp.]|nr:hypothetical protein [Muribaculum sp.]
MITEPSIAISKIRQILNVEVALGKLSEETVQQIERSLQLDWEVEKWQQKQTKEGSIEMLADLLEHFDVQIGTNNGGAAEFQLRFGHFGYATFEHNELDAELVRLFPKQHKRVEMFYKVFNLADDKARMHLHIDMLKPILAATKKLRGWNKVTDKEYEAMLAELKEYIESV